MLTHAPVSIAPDFDKPFKLVIHASDIGVGGLLVQEDDEGIDHPLSFYFKKLNKYQKNVSYCAKRNPGLGSGFTAL